MRIGVPNLAAVHHLLQPRFDIASYLLIPRERYGEALDYLQAQRANAVMRSSDAMRPRFVAMFFGRFFLRATEPG